MNPQPNPELLAELKAYVFSLYNLQKVALYNDVYGTELRCLYGVTVNEVLTSDSLHECFDRHRWDEYGERFSLQLRHLQSITDQEAIEVGFLSAAHFIANQENYGSRFYKTFIENNVPRYQQLQQSGFALPIYFKGVQYSVEQLQELGIITLKS